MSDIKNKILGVQAGIEATTITAGAAGEDATAIEGEIISRESTGQMFRDGLLLVPYTAALGAGKNMKLTAVLSSGADTLSLSGADTLDYTVSNDDTAADTLIGVAHFPFDLAGCADYIQADVTPDMSAANTDTADLGPGLWVFGDGQLEPVDQS